MGAGVGLNVSDEEETALRRVRFFGVNDLAAGWYVPRVAEIAEQFDPSSAPTSVMDIIELHNAEQYLRNGLPTSRLHGVGSCRRDVAGWSDAERGGQVLRSGRRR